MNSILSYSPENTEQSRVGSKMPILIAPVITYSWVLSSNCTTSSEPPHGPLHVPDPSFLTVKQGTGCRGLLGIYMRNECNRCDNLPGHGKYVLYWFGTFYDEHLYQMRLTNFIKVELVMQHRPELGLSSSPWRRQVPVKTGFLKLSNISMCFTGNKTTHTPTSGSACSYPSVILGDSSSLP